MSAGTMLCWTLLVFDLFVFVCGDQKNITAESGQDVTLTCRGPKNNISVVEWSRADLGDEYVLFYRNELFDPENQHPSFKNRVDLQDRQMKDGDVSLILKDVTTNDNGTYECRIKTKTNTRKRVSLDTYPISIITLSVVDPPGQTEDNNKDEDGRKDGSVGLIVGGKLVLRGRGRALLGVSERNEKKLK